MKILRLDLRAFGPFTDEVLDLAQGRQTLHLVYGPNEAGKSSALRALRNFFFGIPARSGDNFIHPHTKMRVGAMLETADGRVWEFMRRKGNRNTLRDAADEKPVQESVLAELLGGVDEVSFEKRYGIGYEELVQGGRDIVQGGGDLGHSLFAAASGIANLNAAQAQLDAEAEALFLPSARIRQINKSVNEYHDLQKQIKECLLPTARWREHDRLLRDAEAERAEVRQTIQANLRRQALLERVARAIPIAARRRQISGELEPLREAPLLHEEFAEQRLKTATAREVAAKTAEREQKNLAQLEEALGQLGEPAEVLQHAEVIAQLQQRLGSHQKAMEDRRLRVAEREVALNTARALLKELGRDDLQLDEADQLRLTRDQHVRIQNLGNEKSKLVERVETTQANQAEVRERLEEVVRQLQASPPPRDEHALRAALEAARDAGPLEKQLAQLQAEQTAAASETELALSKLGGWSGTLADLQSLPLPADETIDRFEQELGDLQQELKTLRASAAECEKEAQDLDEQIDKLRRAQDVPTEEDLAAARQLRQQGWELVRQALSGQAIPQAALAALLQQLPGAEDLPQAFADAVARADHLADRLRREATQVAEKAQLLARRDTLARRVESIRLKQQQTLECHEQLERQWREVWTPAGVTPLSPREMRAWLRQAQSLCSDAQAQRTKQREMERLEAALVEHRSALLAALAAVGQAPPEREPSLVQLIRRADMVATAIEDENCQRQQLAEQQEKLKRDLEKSNRATESSAQQLADWAQQWAEATKPLRLRTGAEPAEANAAVEATKALLDHTKDARSLEQRIEAIDRDADVFRADVRKTSLSAAPHLASESVEQVEHVVAQLVDLMNKARTVEAQRAHLQEQQVVARQRLEAAEHECQHAAISLKNMCQEAGCQQPEQLPEAEQRSQRRRELERKLGEIDQQLAEIAGEQTLDEFLDNLAQYAQQEVLAELQQLQDEGERLRQRESVLGETIGQQRRELDCMDGNARAAEARQQAEQLLAKLRGDTEQYARLHLAAVVLKRAIERYRKQHQGPVLERASELFSALTLGRFASLRAELDDADKPVVVGVRSGTGEAVHVDGMSDGTCDQLYLALRLASLEEDLARREPLPFVVDDILIKFDDDRTAAAFRALAALSKKTQVILFTHHEHIVELAQQLLPPEVLSVHRLDSRQNASHRELSAT